MHDPETPNGYQDADIQAHNLRAQAAKADAMRRHGVCSHGSGKPNGMGGYLCADCGKLFASFQELMRAHREALE